MFKKTVPLLLILCVLLGIFYLINHRKNTDQYVSFFNIDSTRIARIDISTKDEKVILQKINDEWRLVSPLKWLASQDQMNVFYSKVLKVKVIKTPMSEDIQSQDTYKVTPEKALVLTMYDSRSHLIDTVLIGKSLNNNFCYARRPGSNAIYQLRDNIYDYLAPSTYIWRSQVIVPVVLQNLTEVKVTYISNTYRLVLDKDVWYYEDAQDRFQLDPTNLATGKLFNALEGLQTYRFIDNGWKEVEKYFKKPAATITMTDKFGKIVKVTFAVSPDNTVYLMKDEDESTLYLMSLDTLNRFTISAPHFK